MSRVRLISLGTLLLFVACFLCLRTVSHTENGVTQVCGSAAHIMIDGFHSHGGELTQAEHDALDWAENRKCQAPAWRSVGTGFALTLAAVGIIGLGLRQAPSTRSS